MSETPEYDKSSVKGLVVLATLFFVCSTAFAQSANTNNSPAKPAEPQGQSSEAKKIAKAPFTLKVKRTPILNITLTAYKAPLSEIAAALSKELRTQVFVAPALHEQLISIEFAELTLEPAMQLMAPMVYIDYEISTGVSDQPKALGIFFYPADSAEPPVSSVVPGSSQSLLIEGDTEEGVEPKTDEEKKRREEQPLRVQFQNNSLSIKAKKQPLALVLLKVGDELGIPVDIQYDAAEIVDTEISKLSVEDAMRHLSPNILLFVRADLSRAERRILRLVLAEPPKPKPAGP